MKKRILYIIGSISIILAIIYLLRYKTGNDISHNIPSDAVAVVNINLRNLEHHLLLDFLKHPLKYFNKSSEKKSNAPSLHDFYKAVDLDKNWVFYTTKSDYSTWFSDAKMINDKVVVETFLTAQKFDKKTIVKDKNVTDIFVKKNLYCILNTVANKKMIQFCYSTDNLQQIYERMPNNSSLTEESFIYQHLLKTPNDIVFVSKNKNIITADFVDGAIDMNGNLESDFFQNTAIFSEDGLISLDVKVNKKSELYQTITKSVNRKKFAKITQMSFDSIQKYWDGDLHFHLRRFEKKKDTIKTYAYDDDFNKIEKIAVQNQFLPDFSFRIGTKSAINNYLIKNNVLQVVNNDSVFVAFPLVKTYCSVSKKQIDLYSKNPIKLASKHAKLQLFFDLNHYRQQADSTLYRMSVFPRFSMLKLEIDGENSLKGRLTTPYNRNAFVLLTE